MRIHLSILAVIVTCATLSAQTTYQRWDLHPNATSFTSRGNIGSGVGSVYQGVHADTNRGVLDVGGKCAIARFSTITQDQNCSTREKFGYVARLGSDAVGPLTGTFAELGRVTGLQLPNGPNGACAWNLTSTLAPGARIAVPCTEHWDYGMELTPAPNWTADGQSVHAARGAPSSNPLHNSHANQTVQAWQIVGNAAAASAPSQKRSWRLSVDVADGAVMNLQCGGRPGYGGSFPIASSSSMPLAWDARLDGGANCSGAASLVAIGVGRTFGIGGLGNGANLYLAGPFVLVPGPVASTAGVAVVPLLPFIPSSASGAGTFHMQGVLGTTTGIKLTNSQSVIP